MGTGPHGRSDGWLIKMNRLGDTLWTKTFGGTGDDGLRSILLLPDDGFLLCGYTNSYGAGSFDCYVIRTNLIGDTLWTRTYGGPDYETAWSVDSVHRSGFIVGGVLTRGSPPTQVSWFSLVRIAENGDTLWTKTIDGAADESPACVRHTRDGGFAFVGTTFVVDKQDEALLVKTNQLGETQWRRSFGGPIDDNAWSLEQCADGGYIIAGMICENTFDAYLVKTDESGLIAGVGGGTSTAVPESFHLSQNYPNPFNPSSNITYQISNPSLVTLKVFDILGREVATLVNEVKQPGTYAAQWDADRFAGGVYLYRLSAGNFVETKKLVLLK